MERPLYSSEGLPANTSATTCPQPEPQRYDIVMLICHGGIFYCLGNELSHDPLYVHTDCVGLARTYPYAPIPNLTFSHSG